LDVTIFTVCIVCASSGAVSVAAAGIADVADVAVAVDSTLLVVSGVVNDGGVAAAEVGGVERGSHELTATLDHFISWCLESQSWLSSCSCPCPSSTSESCSFCSFDCFSWSASHEVSLVFNDS